MTAGGIFIAAELAAVRWRKSTRSGNTGGGNCVEVGTGGAAGLVSVRDSKNPEVGMLTCSPASWAAFGVLLNTGELDHRP